MKINLKYILFYFLAIIMNLHSQTSEVKTVDHVDLKRYAGLWYEIARIPNKFQTQCVKGTTAKYTIDDDGDIKVINSCIDEDGEIDDAEGVAKVVDKESNAKLEVSFVSFLGIRPFWGDYWIIGLDENYKWAVVGTPNRKYGWILSRTKKLDENTMNEINEILKNNGYDPEDFIESKQD